MMLNDRSSMILSLQKKHYELFSVSAKKAISEGRTPAIVISGRAWNDVSSGASLQMEAPVEVLIIKKLLTNSS